LENGGTENDSLVFCKTKCHREDIPHAGELIYDPQTQIR
jgi:hypothetical protein